MNDIHLAFISCIFIKPELPKRGAKIKVKVRKRRKLCGKVKAKSARACGLWEAAKFNPSDPQSQSQWQP